MLKTFGETQQKILRLLHRNSNGLTIDALATELGITRTAIKQHLHSLSYDGYVNEGGSRETGGRPVRTYLLSREGQDLFQKQYSWFSELLLRSWKGEIGENGIKERMLLLAEETAAAFLPNLKGLTDKEKLEEIVRIMNSLSYEAEKINDEKHPEIQGIKAWNCVYHRLAKEFPEVCGFDIALLEKLSGKSVDHQECIIKGGNLCRFAFIKKNPD